MKPLIKIKYDKLKYTEYISQNGKEKSFAFGYPLLNFVSSNIKEILSNSNDLLKDLENICKNDNNIIFNIFYADDIKRQLQYNNLDTSSKENRVKNVLKDFERKQLTFSTIIDFCFLYNNDKYAYNREIDRFIFICNKLNYSILQPKYSFTTFDVDKQHKLNIKDIDFETLDKEYINFKLDNRKLNHFDDISYTCDSIDEFFSICMLTIFERNYTISRCKNCGKLFVPFKKNDALYCDRISPQKENKTCKEYASKQPKGVIELYRKIYMKKFARVNRNKDSYTLKNEFETWKETADELKTKYKKGLITDETFEKWLIDNDK